MWPQPREERRAGRFLGRGGDEAGRVLGAGATRRHRRRRRGGEGEDGSTARAGGRAQPPPVFRCTRSGAKLCPTGITCSVFTFTRGGRVATQCTASAMSSGVSGSAPS